MIFIAGVAGFIDEIFVYHLFERSQALELVNIVWNKLTCLSKPQMVKARVEVRRCTLVEGDFCDRALVTRRLDGRRLLVLLHVATGTYVDRCIYGFREFTRIGTVGTFELLKIAQSCSLVLGTLKGEAVFRFLQVSVGKVYNSLRALAHGSSTTASTTSSTAPAGSSAPKKRRLNSYFPA